MTTLERIADTFFPEPKKGDYTTYGRVTSVNPDGSYQVQLNASGTDTRCTKLCDASAGDSVLVIVQSNGRAAAIGRVGGIKYIAGEGGKVLVSSNYDADRVGYEFSFYSQASPSPYVVTTCGSSHPVNIGTSANNGVSSQTRIADIMLCDKNGTWAAKYGTRTNDSGRIVAEMGAHNIKTDGTSVDNYILAQIDKDGTRSYWVSDQAAFRKAIGVTPTVLYNNTTGTNGTVTLSQTSANFDHMRIYFAINGSTGTRSSVDVYNRTTTDLSGTIATSDTVFRYVRTQVTISGTSITPNTTRSGYFQRDFSSGTISGQTSTNLIYIQRVEGWNS